MIKAGDRVEWKGVNRIHTGVVTESENGELTVKTDNGSFLPLPFLLPAASFKVIREG